MRFPGVRAGFHAGSMFYDLQTQEERGYEKDMLNGDVEVPD